MRETDFIDQNKKKWGELESLSRSKKKDPQSLSDLYVEVCNDLSYSKSYYPNRSIKIYLNNLAQGVHANVYKNRLGARKRFVQFWTDDLPRVMYESRKDLLTAFLVFTLAILIGVFSSMHDPSFARHILGESYVEMTEEYIESGDPMAVYKKMNQTDMFAYITLNNLRVSFLVFVLGAFFSVGTISVLIYNGVMVGTFQYFFIERGLFQESFLTIWMHGMPEIMSIVIAGAAGLTLGRGLIFPGTFARKESFLIAARRGIMIMVGISPIIIFSAFIEGFATRYTEVPDLVRACIIFLSASFMIYYFVIYPYRKFGRGAFNKTSLSQVPETLPHDFGLEEDKTNTRIYTDIFALYSRTAFNLFPRFLGFSLLYVIAIVFMADESFADIFTGSSLGYGAFDIFMEAVRMSFIKVDQLFRYGYDGQLYFYFVNVLFFAAVVSVCLRQFALIVSDKGQELSPPKFYLKQYPIVLIVSLLANLVFFLPTPLSFFFMLVLMPFFIALAVNRYFTELRGISFRTGVNMIISSLGQHVGLFLTTMVTAILFILIFNSGLIDFLLEMVLWNFKMEDSTYNLLLLSIKMGFTILALSMVSPLFIYASSFRMLAGYEKETASGLKRTIAQIATQKRAYGLAKEEN